jgi:hypothetical protein
MSNQIKLLTEEIEMSNNLYRRRIDYLIKLGEVKLSEINNEKTTEETYFNLLELNTREAQYMGILHEKYGMGSVDLANGVYILKSI